MSKHPGPWNSFRDARRKAQRQRVLDQALQNLPAPIEDEAIEAPPIPRTFRFPWCAAALAVAAWAGIIFLVTR